MKCYLAQPTLGMRRGPEGSKSTGPRRSAAPNPLRRRKWPPSKFLLIQLRPPLGFPFHCSKNKLVIHQCESLKRDSILCRGSLSAPTLIGRVERNDWLQLNSVARNMVGIQFVPWRSRRCASEKQKKHCGTSRCFPILLVS